MRLPIKTRVSLRLVSVLALVGIISTVTVGMAAQKNKSQDAISVWWPTDQAAVTGFQPFKALVEGRDVGSYEMQWSVDGGVWNPMWTSWADHPHKEALVDLTNWTWRGRGPYAVTFSARKFTGEVFAQTTVSLFNSAFSETAATTTVASPKSIAEPEPVVSSLSILEAPKAIAREATSNPFSGQRFWADPNSDAVRWVERHKSSEPDNARLMAKIASQGSAAWFGSWNGDVKTEVAQYVGTVTNAGSLPVLVAYNIPHRDCGGYSGGGAGSAQAYRDWVTHMASGIGNRKAVVILEPDALAGMDCLSADRQIERVALLRDAVITLQKQGATAVYVDAGHSAWHSSDVMAERLKRVGGMTGFALNVSNYYPTNQTVSYGTAIAQKLGGMHFVIDTSRNGAGSGDTWCNPDGRALGDKPSTATGNALVDAYIWIKLPGESDGSCNGGPSAGQFWPEYALGLAQRASW